MRKVKQQKLADRGWKVGEPQEFLRLSKSEEACIELRLKLVDGPRSRRKVIAQNRKAT